MHWSVPSSYTLTFWNILNSSNPILKRKTEAISAKSLALDSCHVFFFNYIMDIFCCFDKILTYNYWWVVESILLTIYSPPSWKFNFGAQCMYMEAGTKTESMVILPHYSLTLYEAPDHLSNTFTYHIGMTLKHQLSTKKFLSHKPVGKGDFGFRKRSICKCYCFIFS